MKLLNEKEAAARLHVAPITLRKQRCIGATPGGLPLIPWVKLGCRIGYIESDIDAIIQAHRVDPTGGGAAA